MRNLILAIALPLAVLAIGLTPWLLRDDGVQPGEEEHARRLIGQASVMSDLRIGRPVVRSMTVTDRANFDAVEGEVTWLGPFGVTVLEVEVGARDQHATAHPRRAAVAWGGVLAAALAGPALVIWRETRT